MRIRTAARLVFILLTPFWLAALWAFGLYREPGRSIGGMNLSESLEWAHGAHGSQLG